MNKKKKSKILVKVTALFMAIIGAVPFLQGCAKDQRNKTVEEETNTSGYNDYTNLPVNDEIVIGPETKTVYVYEKIQDMSSTSLDAEVGKTIKIARNDKYAEDAYSAIENKNCISIKNLNFIDENTELVVEAVAGFDKEGRFYTNYKSGARNKKDDLGMAVLLSYKGKDIGWIADMDYRLARNVMYETETENSNDKLISTSEVPVDKQVSNNYIEEGEVYLFKAR